MKVKTAASCDPDSNWWDHAARAPYTVGAWDRLPIGWAVLIIVGLSLLGWAILLTLLLRLLHGVTAYADARENKKHRPVIRSSARRSAMDTAYW